MGWVGVAFFVTIASRLLWAFTASYAASTLQAYWPDTYAKLGSPKPSAIWFSRSIGTPFDSATMLRRFRRMNIENHDILLQLELTCWFRWVSLVSLVVTIVGIFASIGGANAP